MEERTQTFRAGVGIAIVNRAYDVLALERSQARDDGDGGIEYAGTGQWQMAQGGIDAGEEPEQAAYRELREELGLHRNDVTLLFEKPDWLAYELPADARDERLGRGQVQKWFFFELVADETKIDLSGGDGGKPEFVRFCWMPLAKLAAHTWYVRQPIYQELLRDLDRYKARVVKPSWDV